MRSLRSPAALAISSQAVYAASNIGLTLLAAYVLGPSDFGWFSLAMIAYLVVRGPIVAGVAHGAIVAGSADPATTLARCTRAGLRFGSFGAAAGLIAAVSSGRTELVLLAAAVPVLMSFEVTRVAALGVDRAWVALTGDLVWFATQFAGSVLIVTRVGEPSVALLATPWVLGGLLASLAGRVDGRSIWTQARSVTSAQLDQRFALDELLSTGLQRLALASGALVVSAAAVAQTRLAILPFNVVAVGLTALQPMLLVQLRDAATDRTRVIAIWARFSAIATASTLANLAAIVVALWLMGDRLGENIDVASGLLGWVVLLRITAAMTMLLSSTIKANPRSPARALLIPRIVHGVLTVLSVLVVGTAVGLSGIAIGVSLGSLAGVAVWGRSALTVLDLSPTVNDEASPQPPEPGTSVAIEARPSRSHPGGRNW